MQVVILLERNGAVQHVKWTLTDGINQFLVTILDSFFSFRINIHIMIETISDDVRTSSLYKT